MGGGPWDFSVSPSPFGLDFGTLDFGTSDSGLTILINNMINSCSLNSIVIIGDLGHRPDRYLGLATELFTPW